MNIVTSYDYVSRLVEQSVLYCVVLCGLVMVQERRMGLEEVLVQRTNLASF